MNGEPAGGVSWGHAEIEGVHTLVPMLLGDAEMPECAVDAAGPLEACAAAVAAISARCGHHAMRAPFTHVSVNGAGYISDLAGFTPQGSYQSHRSVLNIVAER